MAKGFRVVPNRAGYRAVLNSSQVQADVQKRAEAIARRANASIGRPEGYRLDDFEVKEWQGKLAKGYVVRTKTDHARASQTQRNTLMKALDAGR